MIVDRYVIMPIIGQFHAPGADTLLAFAENGIVSLLRSHPRYIDAVNMDIISKHVFVRFYLLRYAAVPQSANAKQDDQYQGKRNQQPRQYPDCKAAPLWRPVGMIVISLLLRGEV